MGLTEIHTKLGVMGSKHGQELDILEGSGEELFIAIELSTNTSDWAQVPILSPRNSTSKAPTSSNGGELNLRAYSVIFVLGSVPSRLQVWEKPFFHVCNLVIARLKVLNAFVIREGPYIGGWTSEY